MPSRPPENFHGSVRFGCQNTRRNLPLSSASKRGEANFVAKFERAYLAQELVKVASPQQLATGREFALNGFGI